MMSRLTNTLRSLATRVLGGEGVAARRRRFREWRRHRPVAGALVMLLGAVVIGYMPTVVALQTITLGGGRTALGVLCAVLVAISAVGVLSRPGRSTLFGVTGSAFSLLSLVGTLGGFLVGTTLGFVGGSLCIAWTDERADQTPAGTDEVAQ